MKKLLLFVTMAAALLFTQCKKDDKNSMPSAGKTVKMTVTAGPGSKTDITPDGAITWSAGDRLYVGDGEKYIGYLTLVGEGGSATGVFTGNVTLGEGVTGKKSFGFFYLGSADDYSSKLTSGTSTFVDVDFSSQNIAKGKSDEEPLQNASKCHVGYGSATGTVVGNVVTDINVMLVSKVAIARFSFTKDKAPYEGALTLSGTNICNKMTVNFSSDVFACTGTKGNISLTNETTSEKDETTSEKYVMLVPTNETTGSQELTFEGDGVSGKTTLAKGIEANKFYGMKDAIEVPLEASAPATPVFSVASDKTVEFAPGNLYWDGSAFHFESNQWETTPTAVDQSGSTSTYSSSHVSHFLWSPNKDVAVGTSTSVTGNSGDVFFTNDPSDAKKPNKDFHVDGETAGTWRTLSSAEWVYLMNTRSETNRFAKAKVSGVQGLLIFPDKYSGTTSGTGIAAVNSTDAAYPSDNIPSNTWTSMESAGVVFLPAAGRRYGTDVHGVGSYGYYWSSTYRDSSSACYLSFGSGGVCPQRNGSRSYGISVRLVR